MLAKAWIAILLGLLLGSLLFSSGCGWFGGQYCNDPYYYGSPNNGVQPGGVPAGGAPAAGAGGWRAAPATGGAPAAGAPAAGT